MLYFKRNVTLGKDTLIFEFSLKILYLCCCFVCFETGFSLWSPGCPGLHSVSQAVLKLSLPLECWDYATTSTL